MSFCETCRHFWPSNRCHRHPPVYIPPVTIPVNRDWHRDRWEWPIVTAASWCGEHEPQEKISTKS